MVKKIHAKPTKSSPSADHPLKLDEAMRKIFPDGSLAERLDRADDPFYAQRNNAIHAGTQTNHKTFNRQKKV